MDTIYLASLAGKVLFAVIGLHYLIVAYFKIDKKNENRKLFKLIGWISFIGGIIASLQQFFWQRG